MITSIRHALIFSVIAGIFTLSALADEVNVTWVDRFNGENNGVAENDYSQAIALDSMGNIYVSGFSFQQVQQNSYSPRFVTSTLR